MSDETKHDDLAQDLHAMRAEPRPEFARELDRRAAGWLAERPRRWRLPTLRIAIPAVAGAAAAAVVIALVVSGGDGGAGGEPLDVAVVSEGTPGFAAPQSGAAGGATAAPEDSLEPQLEAAPEAPKATGGAFLLPTTGDGTVMLQYVFAAPTEATVELAGHEAKVELEAGSGSLKISTEGLPPGEHELTITTPSAPTYRQTVKTGG